MARHLAELALRIDAMVSTAQLRSWTMSRALGPARGVKPVALREQNSSESDPPSQPTNTNAPARAIASAMAAAAAALLDTFDPEQRQLALFPFSDGVERRRWYYTPTDHGGVTITRLRPAQQQLAMRLLASGLSEQGYVTVSTIFGLENVLDRLEGWTAAWNRERGRDPGLYYLRIFGWPGRAEPWAWRVGGHHVSINYTVVDGRVVSSTPFFLGADPASSPLLGGSQLRPLAGAEDCARSLARSLTAAQLDRARMSRIAPVDIVGANRVRISPGDEPLPLADVWRGRFVGDLGDRLAVIQTEAEARAGLRPAHLAAVSLSTTPKGILVADFDAEQLEILGAVLDNYLDRIPLELARMHRSRYSNSKLNDLTFAWAGGLEPGEGHYYRVEGPDILIEYNNTQRDANHIHTVWREPGLDFGGYINAGIPR